MSSLEAPPLHLPSLSVIILLVHMHPRCNAGPLKPDFFLFWNKTTVEDPRQRPLSFLSLTLQPPTDPGSAKTD